MPLFKVSVAAEVPVSAVVVSHAATLDAAIAETSLLQDRARVNWQRGDTFIGSVQAPYKIWGQPISDGTFLVSLSATILISSLLTFVAHDSNAAVAFVQQQQAAGLIKWTYRDVPIGTFTDPIPTIWPNRQPDIVTTTDISLSTLKAYPGQSVTLNADVSGAETPVGNLEFRDATPGGYGTIVPTTLEADAVTPGLAHAQSVVVLPNGSYQVIAAYLGSDGYAPSTSPVAPLSVAKVDTLVSISGPSTAYSGQVVLLNVSVSQSNKSAPPPSGVLTLFQGTTVISSTKLAAGGGEDPTSGFGSFDLGKLPPGVYDFTIQYGGDDVHNSTSSDAPEITVLQAPTFVVLNLFTPGTSHSVSTSVYTQPVQLTAFVTSNIDGTTPTGTVTFKDGATVLGTASLTPGGGANTAVAFFTQGFTVGSHSLTAIYNGNANFGASSSNAVPLTTSKASTSMFAYSTNTPTRFGQAANFTASVLAVAPSTATPFGLYGTSGFVTFVDVTTTNVNFNSDGHANRSLSTLNAGTNAIQASFAATAEFNACSVIFTHVVNKADTTLSMSFSPNPSAWYLVTTATVHVNTVAPAVGTATGTVSFSIFDPHVYGNLFLGTVNVVSGVATIAQQAFLYVSDNYNVTAVYSGSSNFNGSSVSGLIFIYGYFF